MPGEDQEVGLMKAYGGGQEVSDRYRTLTDAEVLHIAFVCHEANRAYCDTIGDASQPRWSEAPQWQKDSAIDGVRKTLDSSGKSLSRLSDAEISHNSWLEKKLRDGWTYGSVKDPTNKKHPCCLPYAALPPEEKRKDHLFRAVCMALDPRGTV